MSLREKTERWLDSATGTIRFGPDRRAVRAELREHIQDRLDALGEDCGLAPEEAEAEALRGMGDARELGRKLAKVHRPWLGWLWYASRVLLGIALLLCLAGIGGGMLRWEPGGLSGALEAPAQREPERAVLGGYTFRIAEAKERDGAFRVVLRVSRVRFWEPADAVGLLRHLRLELEDGTRIAMHNPAWRVEVNRLFGRFPDTAVQVEWGSGRGPDPSGEAVLEVCEQERLFTQDIALRFGPEISPRPGERITLTLTLPLGEVRLSARCGEEGAA